MALKTFNELRLEDKYKYVIIKCPYCNKSDLHLDNKICLVCNGHGTLEKVVTK